LGWGGDPQLSSLAVGERFLLAASTVRGAALPGRGGRVSCAPSLGQAVWVYWLAAEKAAWMRNADLRPPVEAVP
jgi:hypothetical protein